MTTTTDRPGTQWSTGAVDHAGGIDRTVDWRRLWRPSTRIALAALMLAATLE